MVYILAGNSGQASRLASELCIQRDRWRYVHTAEKLRVCRSPLLIVTGTWFERKDSHELELVWHAIGARVVRISLDAVVGATPS